jgi:RNA ligase
MTYIDDVLDPGRLRNHVEEGYISKVEGPDRFRLYNYTSKTQWNRAWDRETMACRGLVVDREGRIQSRPFPKFFNLSEHSQDGVPGLVVTPFRVFEKLDGSLIIGSSRPDPQPPLFTTRGSFESTQAKAAAGIWADSYGDVVIPEGETWCFELIAPWNRIVVDYGATEDLILLARIDNATGRNLDIDEAPWPGNVARSFDFTEFKQVTEACAALGPNEEGFVLLFEHGQRVKVKGAEYMRLHRLLTGVSAKSIWECLAADDQATFELLVDRVPDEFHAWVTSTADALHAQRTAIELESRAALAGVQGLPTRKDQALALVDHPHRSIVFSMLDGKDHNQALWRLVKPAADRPFVGEETS